jgi:hypothetical protein
MFKLYGNLTEDFSELKETPAIQIIHQTVKFGFCSIHRNEFRDMRDIFVINYIETQVNPILRDGLELFK